jgi:hypothetical protein
MPAPPMPCISRPMVNMAVEVAPPLIPLPRMKMAMPEIEGHRRPKTLANWPYKGVKIVLHRRNKLVDATASGSAHNKHCNTCLCYLLRGNACRMLAVVSLIRLGHGSGYIPWIKGYFSIVLHLAVSH